MRFTETHISDQKRLVRGEHLQYARSRLRIRDGVHNRKWRVMILAGGDPGGEIRAVRELMPKAVIVAVDRDPQCLERAIECGADDIIECDLTDFTDCSAQRWYGKNIAPPKEILDADDFDLIDLDLCSNMNAQTREILGVYRRKLTSKGVVMMTFSYGRDVEELFHDAWANKYSVDDEPDCREILRSLEANGIPRGVCGRIAYLCAPGLLKSLHSVLLYKGATMPMCSVLFQPRIYLQDYPSATRIEPGDYEVAVVYPDSTSLYDCPQERIESLRRSFAAIKAAYTRMEKTRDRAIACGAS